MQFTSENASDIERYFRKTFLKFQETGDCLFYINQVTPDYVKGTNQDNEEFILYLDNDHPYVVDFVLPRKSCFQYGKYSTVLERIPARQYQRGLSTANTRITAIDGNAGVTGRELDFDSLKAYVTKQAFPTLQEAVNNKKAYVSTALSSRFTYVNKCSVLMLDHIIVAHRERTTFKMAQPIFTSEVQALARGSVFKVI